LAIALEFRSEDSMDQTAPLKVLVSAFAFSPIKGSEFAVGWDYTCAIAARHKVWVIARSNEREETEQYLLKHPEAMSNVTVHYLPFTSKSFDFPWSAIPFHFAYMGWQRRALYLGRILDIEIDFDLVHDVCLTGFRKPGYLWKIGKPFVWGPVCGLQFFPLRLLGAIPFWSRPFFILRNVSVVWAMHLSRRPKRAAVASRAILAASSSVADQIRRLWGKEAQVSCEVSAPSLTSSPPAHRELGEPLSIIWSGGCYPTKGLNIVLLALKQLNPTEVDWRLIVLGDGQCWSKWKRLSVDLELSDRCIFTGRIPRDEALSIMAKGHCFVQPSLYDATSNVIAEALALGLPVICLDHFGFKDAVDSDCGVKVAPNSLHQVVRDFAKSIKFLWLDEDRRYRMAAAAQVRSRRLTRKYKEETINEVYCKVIRDKCGRPNTSR